MTLGAPPLAREGVGRDEDLDLRADDSCGHRESRGAGVSHSDSQVRARNLARERAADLLPTPDSGAAAEADGGLSVRAACVYDRLRGR